MEKGEKEKGEKEGGEEDSTKDEESVGGADGEDKEGEDQKEQVINYSGFFVSCLGIKVSLVVGSKWYL
jgi:hypothetical protein